MMKLTNCCLFVICFLIAQTTLTFAQTSSTSALKKMSMEDLMKLEVSSVSKRPEKLTEVASAIQVITSDDIRRSGATSLPEALRLASNLQVAQISSYSWIISARGFNAFFSNKLLVMIDGRTVYSPLFAGVFWDAQNVLLENIDRIEVISGPGGTIWGANAVNGVINIITKSSEKTQGIYATAAAGTFLKDHGAVRYGVKPGAKTSLRVHAQRFDYDHTYLPDTTPHSDEWGMTEGGIRFDWAASEKDNLMLKANFYGGVEKTKPEESTLDGQYLQARYRKTFSETSELLVNAYADRTWRRDIPSTISDQLLTYDVDAQHRFKGGKRHSLQLGLGYRLMTDQTQHSTDFVGFLPEDKTMNLFSSFVQDEISLAKEKIKITLGTKVQHNNYSGFEFQPSARVAYTPGSKHTIWGAVSRAVRTPSRIDVDYYIPTFPVPEGVQNVNGGPDFVSETVVTSEIGYRVHPVSDMFISVAAFYNSYDDLYSVEPLPGTLTYRIMNGTVGESYGVELSATVQPFKIWHIRGGYTYFFKELRSKPGHSFDSYALGNDPEHTFIIHSILNLPWNLHFDNVVRYSDFRPNTYAPSYIAFETRLAWNWKGLELSVTGQNLPDEYHMEFGPQIKRSVFGRITYRFTKG